MDATKWRTREGNEPFFARGEIPPLQNDELAKEFAQAAGFASVAEMHKSMGKALGVDLTIEGEK